MKDIRYSFFAKVLLVYINHHERAFVEFSAFQKMLDEKF